VDHNGGKEIAMLLRSRLLALLPAALLVAAATADTLTLADGTVVKDCYVRDEGVQITVWTALDQVGTPPQVYPRSAVKEYKIERGADWDARPARPDLSVTFIEVTPKLAGLHGLLQYDDLGRPAVEGQSSALVAVEGDKHLKPDEITKNLKLKYAPGEELTLTAHVKNLGFAPAQPFKYAFFIAAEGQPLGQPLAEGACAQSLKELEDTSFTLKWKWQEGRYLVTFKIITDQPEIAIINNQATDALWAWSYTFVVSKGRIAAWHENRTAYGTFSFEDFYRWHIDLMNLLFAHSVYPATPHGITARVRLDRIIYADSVKDNEPVIDGKVQHLAAADGVRYDQGGWSWNDDPKEIASGKWGQTDPKWRNQTEWSLPHELGHQLGAVDHYNTDYEGTDDHQWPDNQAKVSHFERYPEQMMHWHGPQVYGEVDAAYYSTTQDKPRGNFGDYYFALPKENRLHLVDINGQDLPGAKVEIFQRGTVVDAQGPGGEQHGVRWFAVKEDGNFDPPVSKAPVMVGQTDAHGVMPLINRPAAEVRTTNGFHRVPNPFGNINVVGQRGLLMIRVTVGEKPPVFFCLEAQDFIAAWFRGHKDEFIVTLKTPFASVDSPPPPATVKIEKAGEHAAKITWLPPKDAKERQYLERVIGYRVYLRVSNEGLNDRPWFAVATVGPEKREVTVDLRDRPEDVYWFKPQTVRAGVTSLAACSLESELVSAVMP
jgi:hypothetical protein